MRLRLAVACALVGAVLACTPMPNGEAPITHDCTDILACIKACPAGGTCVSNCISSGTSKGRNEYVDALSCGQDVCAGKTGMVARCQLDMTTSTYVDAPGRASGDCNACLGNALARLFGFTCSPLSDPYCNPPSCTDKTSACVND